jgi:hypothetical protein
MAHKAVKRSNMVFNTHSLRQHGDGEKHYLHAKNTLQLILTQYDTSSARLFEGHCRGFCKKNGIFLAIRPKNEWHFSYKKKGDAFIFFSFLAAPNSLTACHCHPPANPRSR